MPRRSKTNRLTPAEVALVKAMVARGDLSDQTIQAYFTRPGRSVNNARILEIRRGQRFTNVPVATDNDLQAFLANWPEVHHVTGLHPVDDELVVKAREAMLSAIRTYNNPGTIFRSETFIVLAMIAWTYLLHWYYKKTGVDYQYRKTDGNLLTTKHGAVKHWELETCLDSVQCPLEDPVKDNLRFLMVIRHEIEHQMTGRIDDAISAKIQACCLNFNNALHNLVSSRCGLDREMSIAIQLAGIEREQRKLLLTDMGLPAHFLAAQEAFEQNLSAEVTQDPRYAWRVIMIHRNTNSKGRADEIVEFVKPGSDVAGEIHRVLQKEVEKTKYRASDIVSAVRKAGFKNFNMHDHTLLWQRKGAKDPLKKLGAFVDIQKKDWRWYQSWLDDVMTHCTADPSRYGRVERSAGRA